MESIKTQCIYIIRSISDPSKFYIGGTIDFKARERLHLNNLLHGSHHSRRLQDHYNQFGKDDFEFQVLEVVKDLSQLPIIETKYLQSLKPFFNTFKVTYKRKHPVSQETREKLRKSSTGRKGTDYQKKRVIELNKSRVYSEETRRKIGLARKGQKHTVETLAKISPLGRRHTPETIDKIRKSALLREENKRRA